MPLPSTILNIALCGASAELFYKIALDRKDEAKIVRKVGTLILVGRRFQPSAETAFELLQRGQCGSGSCIGQRAADIMVDSVPNCLSAPIIVPL